VNSFLTTRESKVKHQMSRYDSLW